METTTQNIVEQRIAEEKAHGLNYVKLAEEVMQNYPEYSSLSLQCTDWNYEGGRYLFEEDTESVEHVVTHASMAKGLELYHLMIQNGQWRGDKPDDFWDAGAWDAITTDIALQLSLFGEVIYG